MAGLDEAQLPATLYHYTDMNGLLGIVKKRTLWATEIHYLNDSKEYAYAARLLEEKAKLRHASLGKVQSHVLSAFVETAKMVAQTKAFITCFSEKRDDLSQWRAYSHSGPGYCIGFETSKLTKLVAEKNLLFVPCEYDESEQSALLNALIDKTIAEATNSNLSVQKSENSVMSLPTIDGFMKLATRFKHHKFSDEKEHRITTKYMGGDPELKRELRLGANLLIPYIEIPFINDPGNLLISEILVGPCPEPELASSSIIELIMQTSIGGTQVANSEIPFRNW